MEISRVSGFSEGETDISRVEIFTGVLISVTREKERMDIPSEMPKEVWREEGEGKEREVLLLNYFIHFHPTGEVYEVVFRDAMCRTLIETRGRVFEIHYDTPAQPITILWQREGRWWCSTGKGELAEFEERRNDFSR